MRQANTLSRTSAAAAVFVLILLGLARGGLAQTQLAWDFQKNPELVFRFEQQVKAATRLGGGKLETSIDMVMVLHWKVERVAADGTAQLTQTLRQVTIQMQPAGGEVIRYDSQQEQQASEAAAQIADSIAPLLGAEVQLTVASTGEIQSVKLPDETAAALREAAESSPGGKSLTVEEIEQLFGQAGVTLPAMAVEPGEKWSRTRQVTSPLGPLKLASDYVFEGDHPEGGQKIAVTSKLELAPGSPLQILSQEQQGRIRFDAEAGRLVSSDVTQQLQTQTKSGTQVRTDADTTLKLQVSTP